MKKLYVLRSTVSAYVLAKDEQDAKRHVNEIMRWETPVISITYGEVLEDWEKEKNTAFVYGDLEGKTLTLQEVRDALHALG